MNWFVSMIDDVREEDVPTRTSKQNRTQPEMRWHRCKRNENYQIKVIHGSDDGDQ